MRSEEDVSLRMVREKARITVWPSTVTRRMLDFDLRFRGLVPGVSLNGSDDGKGYGGFAPRVRLGEDMAFLGQVGEVQPQWLAAVEEGARGSMSWGPMAERDEESWTGHTQGCAYSIYTVTEIRY